MDATDEINLGATVCEKLKSCYFAGTTWPDCYKQVAAIFSKLKLAAKTRYPDKSRIEILQLLANVEPKMFHVERKDATT